MSGMTTNPPRRGLGYLHMSARWGWFVGLGVVLLLLGLLALADTVAVTVISTIFIGAAFMVGGVVQVIHAFANKAWSAFLFNLLSGIVAVIGGFLIMDEPVQGSIIITLFLLLALLISGVMRVVIAFQHREVGGWWMLALSGLVSVLFGVLLFMSLPWSGLWVLGTLVAFELLLNGATWIQFGLALRRLHRTSSPHAASI